MFNVSTSSTALWALYDPAPKWSARYAWLCFLSWGYLYRKISSESQNPVSEELNISDSLQLWTAVDNTLKSKRRPLCATIVTSWNFCNQVIKSFSAVFIPTHSTGVPLYKSVSPFLLIPVSLSAIGEIESSGQIYFENRFFELYFMAAICVIWGIIPPQTEK